MFKYIVQSLAVLLLLQGFCSAKSIDTDVDVENPAGLIEAVVAALEKLRKLVDGLVQNALAKVQELYDIINGVAESIIGDCLNKITKIIVGSVRAINEIKEKAIELGVDVAECIGDNENNIKNIGSTMMDNVKEAIGGAVKKGKMMIEETKTSVSNAMDDIKKIEEDFKKCGGITALVCYADLLKNIGIQTVAIPIRIASLMKKLVKFMISAQAEIAVIGAQAIATATVQTAKIVGEVTKCAAKKFGENQLLILLE